MINKTTEPLKPTQWHLDTHKHKLFNREKEKTNEIQPTKLYLFSHFV